MKNKKTPKRFPKKEPVIVNQSQLLSGVTYDEAFLYYLKWCKDETNIRCNIYLRFKNGEEEPITVFSRDNTVLGRKEKHLKVVLNEKNIPYVEINSTLKIPLGFLKAYAFVPCPDQTFTENYRVQYKDGRPSNISIENLMWLKER